MSTSLNHFGGDGFHVSLNRVCSDNLGQPRFGSGDPRWGAVITGCVDPRANLPWLAGARP